MNHSVLSITDLAVAQTVRPSLPNRVYRMAHDAGVGYAHHVWLWLKAADRQGNGVVEIGEFDTAVIPQGEGIFWHESSKEPGVLFLRRLPAVASSLEKILEERAGNYRQLAEKGAS